MAGSWGTAYPLASRAGADMKPRHGGAAEQIVATVGEGARRLAESTPRGARASITVRRRSCYVSGMDLLTITGLAMLGLWILGTFVFEDPGLIHLLLSLGVMLIVLGAVKKAERARKAKR